MRIAHVITRMIIGGAQENTLLCCLELLRGYGDDVLLITGPALGPEGDLLGQGRAGELPVTVLPELRRAVHPWRDWQSYHAIGRALREFRPDVVHTHSAKGGFLGRLAASALDVPVIVHTVHGAPFHEHQSASSRWLFRRCERYAARRCHALVGVSQAMTDLLVDAGVAPRGKFTTIYSGMDVEPLLRAGELRAESRRQLGYADEHVVVGKIARLFHLKGHDFVIEAAASVVRELPNVRFLFVGDGVLRRRLTALVRSAGLEEHVQFTGLAEPEQIPALIAAMDLVVHASLREGLPRALPQALIAGKPVASFDVDGAREVVMPDETGFLVPPKDVRGLADGMKQLAADAELRRRLGENGRQRFTEQFRYQHMTRQLRELYQRSLCDGRGQSHLLTEQGFD